LIYTFSPLLDSSDNSPSDKSDDNNTGSDQSSICTDSEQRADPEKASKNE
jgi:hypothetical protein